ncbi:MAG: hypothetical protein NTW21_28305 [Verrucomicrobia bacterium]|nr:hypothetical protein [Verrucomicrobiota bacterium]
MDCPVSLALLAALAACFTSWGFSMESWIDWTTLPMLPRSPVVSIRSSVPDSPAFRAASATRSPSTGAPAPTKFPAPLARSLKLTPNNSTVPDPDGK